MRVFTFDVARWTRGLDVYHAYDTILTALQSTCGGLNINAIIDAMVYGGIEYDRPYTVHFLNVGTAPEDVRNEIVFVVRHIEEALSEKQLRDGKAPVIIFEIEQ